MIFLKKKISITNVYTGVTLYSLDVSYTMILWNELHSSHTLITEILFLFDQFIQEQAGTLRPPSSKYFSKSTTKLSTDNYVVQTIPKAINTCSTIYNISQWLNTINIIFVSWPHFNSADTFTTSFKILANQTFIPAHPGSCPQL
jgi:hypothetical protein